MFAIECDDAFNYGFIGICVLTFWCLLLKTRFEYLKRKKLQKRGNAVNGIAKNLRKTKTNKSVTYYIDYEFEADDGKSKSLVDGYIRNDEYKMDDIMIPIPIWDLILSFYGKDTLKTTISDSHEVDLKLWTSMNIGDELQIKFDPLNPKEYNIPLIEYESRGPCYWICYLFGCIIAFILSLVLSSNWCIQTTGNGGIDFLWTIAMFCIYTGGFIVAAILLMAICICIMFCTREHTVQQRANNDYRQINGSINGV